MKNSPPKFYTMREAADILCVSEKTVRRRIEKGDIKARRAGRSHNSRILIKHDDLMSHQNTMREWVDPEDFAYRRNPQPKPQAKWTSRPAIRW